VRRLLLLVVLLILYGSLYPFQFDFDRTLESPVWILLHSWPARFDRFTFRDAAANVLFYAPLGFTAVLAFGRRWWAALLLGAGLSTCVEMLQVYDSTRTCSLLDVACNVAGTALGVAAGLWLPKAWALRPTPGRLKTGPLAIAGCWAVYQVYPFVPLLSRGHLHGSVARFSAAALSPVEIAASTAEWFAFAMLADAVWGRFKAWWLALAMLSLPLRLLLAERALAPAEVCGAALALLLWVAIRGKGRAVVGAGLLAAAIVLRELAPFHFAAEPQAFSWIPFSASFAADRMPAVLVILRKAFDYGAMVWLLRPIGVVRAGVSVAAALAVLEWVQRYLPGRQPEITDAVLALMMTIPLVWARR
jgi:VanZ family protein